MKDFHRGIMVRTLEMLARALLCLSDCPGSPCDARKPSFHIPLGPVSDRKVEPMPPPPPIAIVLTNIQQIMVGPIVVLDKAGQPGGEVDNPPTWEAADPSLLDVIPSEDGLSAKLVTKGPVGNCQVIIKGDADLGEGVEEITGVINTTINNSAAAGFSMPVGQPETRPLEP